MQSSNMVDAMQRLLAQARLADGEVAARLAQARSVAYWQGLNPSLAVDRTGVAGVRESKAISPRRRRAVIEHYTADGYFQIDSLLPVPMLRRMCRSIEVLKKEGWPPVFAFIYDPFWQVVRVPSLVRLLSTILGPGYRQKANIWSFHIPTVVGNAGWPPHVDGGESGRQNRLSLWIPLDDATLDNGCMYVLPRRRIPDRIRDPTLWKNALCKTDVKLLLQSCRALPARAGSVLGWDFDIIHWGSRRDAVGKPRVSIAMEFLSAAEKPDEEEQPVFDIEGALPTFAQRLHLIAKAILSYQNFEPLMVRYKDLAERIFESADSANG